MRYMFRFSILWLAWVCAAGAGSMSASAQTCQLCAAIPKADNAAPRKPIHIEVDSLLDFSTAAHGETGAGAIEVDPATGARRVSGGLIGFGGPALRGTVRITGQPFAAVRIEIPKLMAMTSTMGAKATITGITTTLPPNPVIGSNGQLNFSFGGRMIVADGAAGDFRGRFAIFADYQ